MQGIKISHVGRIFALATPSNPRGRPPGRRSKTKEERRVMIVSFVEKYKASNKGKFPTATLTFKEVGGSYYTVREILEELKQENISCGTLGTDLEAIETKNQTRYTVEPLSLPAENANNGVIGSHYSLKHKEANYQEALSDTEEKKIAINNDVLETSGVNNQTEANEERKIVASPLGSNPTSFVVDLQPLQGLPKRQSISSVSNGAINSNCHLELSEALSDTEEQGNIIHNDVEIHDPNDQTQAKQEIKIGERPPSASAASIARDEQGNIIHNDVVEIRDPNDQAQAKQEIKIGERPPRASAASIAKDLEVLLQVIGEPSMPAQSDHWEEAPKGEVSSASIGVRDKNHSLALDEAEYLEVLSDTEEQKIVFQNDTTRTFGPNDQTQAKQETKIVERPRGPSVASVVAGVQPLQEMTEGQSISSVTGGFMDNNHMLELNERKCQEALSDAEEQKNIIHNDVETCGRTPNDQAQLKQEITIIEESPGTSATSNPPAMLEYYKGGEEHLHLDTSKPLSLSSDSQSTTYISKQPKDLSFSAQHEDDNNIVLNSTEGIAEEPAIPEGIAEEPAIPADKIISPLTNSVTALQEATEIPDDVLDDQNLAALNISPDQVLTGVKAQLKQEITIIEESPGTSATSNPPATLEYHGGGEEHLHLDTSKPLSLSSDSHSTTCVSKQPKDLSFSAQHEDDNNLVLNSTEGIAEEPAIPADKIISPLTNSVTALQETTEIPDNVLDDQKLAALNISPDQVLTGVKAFYQVLLHRLALSALVIKTLVHAEDASQKGSSEFQSENLDGYSIDLSDKKETASVLSSSSLDQGGSISDTVQSTRKTNSDGYCASNSENKISSYQEESTGDTMQISHNFSEGNNAPTLENKKRTYENTESSNEREKLETNILGFVSNIVKGILYLLKK